MKYILLPLLALLAICLLLRAQSANVDSITVQYNDGTQQKFIAAAADSSSTQPAARVLNPPRAFGVNLQAIHDYDRSFMFIDAMRSCRKYGTAAVAYGQNAKLDENGWPIEDAGTLVMTEVKNINGTYKFFAVGQCDLTATWATVRNLRYDEKNNRTSADVIVNAPRDKLITLILIFKNTLGGLKNIKLLRPGYDSDADVFTREFLAALQPFNAIRFMDYLRTNDSELKSWNDRATITDGTFDLKGGPYEYAIALGNKANKDIWLNVPALADDDFVRDLGELIRANLNPDLNCFIEYSNEVWNGQFKQFHQNKAAAIAEANAGDTTYTNINNFPDHWAWMRVAKRSIEIKRLLGEDPRIKMILATQVAAPIVVETQLKYVEKNFGAPSQFFYAVAGAPYFSPGIDESDPSGHTWYTSRNDITVDSLCQRLLDRTEKIKGPPASQIRDLAARYNLKSFAYEGGVDFQQFPTCVEQKIAAQFDPRLGEALEGYLKNWYAAGNDGFFYFNLNSLYSVHGYWGLTDDVRNLNTPKYQAVVNVARELK